MFSTKNPGLLIIDAQQAIDHFSEFERNNPYAEAVMAELLGAWRSQALPVIHVRHASKFVASPYHRDSGVFGFKPEVQPLAHETQITKQENSAFLGTELADFLNSSGIGELVVCGFVTNNSVDATVRVAAGLGFEVFVAADATATFGMALLNGGVASAETVQELFLSNLKGEYCQVCDAAQLVNGVADLR